jgi:hypothetical protein
MKSQPEYIIDYFCVPLAKLKTVEKLSNNSIRLVTMFEGREFLLNFQSNSDLLT